MKRFTSRNTGGQPTDFIRYAFLAILAPALLALLSYIHRTNQQIISLRKLPGPILNPLMGWVPWATIDKSNQPHTLVYADLTWRDFELQEGHYDFDTFEKKQQFARWRQEGKRVVFRFVSDVPGSETHLDIPDWLFDQINGDGDYYDNEYGKGFSPNYANPVFIEYHRKAIQALGERYGKDSFFAFIELGSLGHWGEWHTHAEIRPLPSEQVINLYVDHYIEAFPDTYLLMRRPFSIAQKLGLGLYNDMTAEPIQTNTWLDWIEKGGDELTQEGYHLSPMPRGWQKAPIGGEQAPDLSNEQIYSTNLKQTLDLLRKSHTTFIGPTSPYEVEKGGPLQNGIDQVLTTIGYRIYVDHVQIPRQVLYGQDIALTFTFANDGIAPMYYNWPTKLYLWDEKGRTIAMYQPQIDFRKVLPGESYTTTIRMPISHLKNGSYSVGIALIDPMTNQPGVKFANENPRQDLIQYLGSFELKRLLHLN